MNLDILISPIRWPPPAAIAADTTRRVSESLRSVAGGCPAAGKRLASGIFGVYKGTGGLEPGSANERRERCGQLDRAESVHRSWCGGEGGRRASRRPRGA